MGPVDLLTTISNKLAKMKSAGGGSQTPVRQVQDFPRPTIEDNAPNAVVEGEDAVVEVIGGDNTTNAVVLVMALLAWVAQYAVVNKCTC